MLQKFEREKIVTLTKQGKPRAEIAKIMRITEVIIRNVLRPLGLLDPIRSEGAITGAAAKGPLDHTKR